MRRVFCLLLFLVFLVLPGICQGEPPAGVPDPQFGRERPKDPAEVRMEREQLKARNKQRFDNLKKDTDRLLVLATELKQYVDRSNENVLSLEVLRKSDEIEKLARSVRDKMKAE